MDQLLKPNENNEDSSIDPTSPNTTAEDLFPKWAYGVVAAGVTAVGAASAVTYHIVSKRKAQKLAEEEAIERNENCYDVTPRDKSWPKTGEII